MDLASHLTCYDIIKHKFKTAKDTKTPVLIESRDLKYTHSDIVYIKFIGERFVLGYTKKGLPYTINYADYYAEHKGLKVIFKGDNPNIIK
ncbi:hypothetical protein [Lactobacillus acetotolerans]|uniref:hypothetical protein n=1 Tax=Lactobacillus acetotolerans TaxID=1600 RepID=UPI002FDB0122